MGQVILYRQDNGNIATVVPTPEALGLYGIEAIARKDVPSGKPYKIVAIDDLPFNGEFTDGIGAE